MPTQDRGGLTVEHLLLLWAARRSGILDALFDTAGTPAAVAETAGVTPHAARVTVEGLTELGFLKRVSGEYEITNCALGFLAKRDVRSIGRLPHALDMVDLRTALPETMRTGEAPETPPDWTRNRLGAHAATDESTVRACVTAAVREHPEATRVLDIAGGSGVYALEFAARGFDVTLVDDSEVVDVVAPLVEPTPVDLVATDLPPGWETDDVLDAFDALDSFDLLFGVDVARRFSAEANEALVAAAVDTLAPGGAFVLVDAVGGRADDPVSVAVDALATGEGGIHDEAAFRSWFETAGLDPVDVRTVPGTDRHAVVGRKSFD